MTQPATIEDLTQRQLEIIGLLAEGKSNKQIASLLSISVETIRKHVNRACVKLKLDNRMQLIVAWARMQKEPTE